jgi:hypothetical protein
MVIDQIHSALAFIISDDPHFILLFLCLFVLHDCKYQVMNHEVLCGTLEVGWVTD